MNLDAALRLFLETFRLPGESQKIQRILEAFSERYYEQSQEMFVSPDVALVLSYSVILLNTDQHYVRIKKKMTEEDFSRNNRSINGGMISRGSSCLCYIILFVGMKSKPFPSKEWDALRFLLAAGLI